MERRSLSHMFCYRAGELRPIGLVLAALYLAPPTLSGEERLAWEDRRSHSTIRDSVPMFRVVKTPVSVIPAGSDTRVIRIPPRHVALVTEDRRMVQVIDERGLVITTVQSLSDQWPGTGASRVFLDPFGGMQIFFQGSQMLATFDRRGELTSATPLPRIETLVSDVERLDYGRFLLRSQDGLSPTSVGEVSRDTVHFWLWDIAEDQVEEFWTVPGQMTVGFMIDGTAGIREPPLGPNALHFLWRRCLVAFPNDGGELSVIRAAGPPVDSITLGILPDPVTPRVRERWVDAMVERAESEEARPLVETLAERTWWPKSLPHVQSLAVDPVGRIWLERFRPPFGPSGEWWLLWDDGTARLGFQLPSRTSLLLILEDRFIGLRRNTDDSQELVVHRFERDRVLRPRETRLEMCNR